MHMDDKIYVDGGVMQNVDIGSIVRRCSELGYSEKDIVLDIVLSSRTEIEQDDKPNYSIIQILLRYASI